MQMPLGIIRSGSHSRRQTRLRGWAETHYLDWLCFSYLAFALWANGKSVFSSSR